MRAWLLRKRSRWIVGLVGLTIAAAVTGGVAWATIYQDDVVYHGCYGNDGYLRVVGPGVDCKKNESSITWNQDGVPGPPGGLMGYAVVRATGSWAISYQSAAAAICPSGTVAIGGGWFPVDYQGALTVLGTYPTDESGNALTTAQVARGWGLYALNSGEFGPATASIYAVCAND